MKQLYLVAALLAGCATVRGQRSGIEVVYRDGDACECDSMLSFCVDRPKQAAGVQLGSHGYDVVVPTRTAERPVHYNFDYTVQTPVESGGARLLQGLHADVDRVLVDKPDCVRPPVAGCAAARYRPTIDVLPSCADAAHRQRRSLSVEDYALANSDQFYDRTRPLEHQLQQAAADDDDDATTDELFNPARANAGRQQLQLRIKHFFDTLRQLQQQQQQQQQPQQQPPQPQFVLRSLSPPEQRAAAMRAKWSELLGRTRTTNTDVDGRRRRRRNIAPEYADNVDSAAVRPRKHCPTCGGAEDPCSICGGGMPAAAWPTAAAESRPMPTYVERAQQPQPPQQQPPQQQPQQPSQQPQPRYVFDRMGNAYVQYDGPLPVARAQTSASVQRLPDAVVGSASAQPGPEYGILEDILNRNRRILHASNIEGGSMIQEPFQLTADTFGFLHELGDPDSHAAHNYDYQVEQPQPPQLQPQPQQSQTHERRVATGQRASKRSFRLVPLLQDKRDGSVLVRVAPRKPQDSTTDGRRSERRRNDHRSNALDEVAAVKEPSVYGSSAGLDYADGYDIMSLVEGDGGGVDDGSEERPDADLMRLVYGAAQARVNTASSVGGSAERRRMSSSSYGGQTATGRRGGSDERGVQRSETDARISVVPLMAEFET